MRRSCAIQHLCDTGWYSWSLEGPSCGGLDCGLVTLESPKCKPRELEDAMAESDDWAAFFGIMGRLLEECANRKDTRDELYISVILSRIEQSLSSVEYLVESLVQHDGLPSPTSSSNCRY